MTNIYLIKNNGNNNIQFNIFNAYIISIPLYSISDYCCIWMAIFKRFE